MRRIVLWVMVAAGACSSVEQEKVPEADASDTDVVEVVGPGSISTDLNQTFPAIDPATGDLWYSEYEDSFDDQTILFAAASPEGWASPQLAPFSGQWGDRVPRFSPDGSTLYFTSNRPLPGSKSDGDMNIWTVQRQDDGWSDPIPADGLNSEAPDMHVSVSDSATWFASRRDGGFGRSDLYRAAGDRRVTHIGPELNDALSQPDLWISEDESWMILVITDHPDGYGGDDLFVARNVGGQWQAPVNLGAPINTEEYEYGPWLDTDRQFLYFTSHRDGPSHVYRIPMSSITGALEH